MRRITETLTYRNCQIEAYRDWAMGGWSEVYLSAFSADGYEITSGFGGGTVREMFSAMKQNVDSFLDDRHGNKAEWEAF